MNRKREITEHPYVKSEPVIIEDDVCISTNSIILKGVHIGARSIVGAGSIVANKNVPPDIIVVGNPTKIINRSKFL